LALPAVRAWGEFAHETIAFIAQDFVSPATVTFAQKILGDTSSTYMASVASWADTFRGTSAGEWSAPMHFVDALDSPPTTCNVNFNRDCGTLCVISAINNYTLQLTTSSTSTAERLDAIRFVIHFVGDIHQPLHDENLELGGNDIDVTYAGKSTNLHAIWDTQMPEMLGAGSTITTARTFATSLTNAIKAQSMGFTPATWTTGLTLANPITTATGWATDSNAFVCTDVIPSGVSAVEKVDLSGAYYTAHNHVISLQLARAGYRLAAWMNLIATGTTGGL